MAKFTAINAANVAELGIAEISAITPEDKRTILMAGATVLRDGMQNYLQQHHNRTGELAGSIQITEHTDELTVEPAGSKTGGGGRKRKTRFHAGSGASRRSTHHGAKGGSTMQEVAWYLEYGTPRMDATKWFSNSLKEAEADVDKALQEAFDNLIGGSK